MGRYRPPRPESAKYITPEGAARLRRELDELWRVKRPAVTKAVGEAAAQGDRSENAEYIYGKKRLREIDRRVRFLTKRLESATVVDPATLGGDTVRFGASVEVEDEHGNRQVYVLVGADESDPNQGRLSFQSPMGRALLQRRVGDTVVVKRPRGDLELTILSVSYG